MILLLTDAAFIVMQEYSLKFKKSLSLGQKSRKSSVGKILLILSFVIIILVLIYSVINRFGTSKITSPVTQNQPLNKVVYSSKKLLDTLAEDVQKNGGTFSIYIFDIKENKGFGINENLVITAASVNKIPILAVLYKMAGEKTIDLEKIIVPQPSDIQHYGTGSIRYDPTGTPYSLKTLARLMMEKSDNTASYLFAQIIIKPSNIQKQVNDWGLTQTDISENKTSVFDMNILLQKIYRGEITTPSLTKEMLDIMDVSDFDDRIPKGVDEGVKVYHKTGDEVGKIHDVGIVDLPKRPYFIGVMTTDVTSEEETKKTIAKISRKVFDFMKSL